MQHLSDKGEKTVNLLILLYIECPLRWLYAPERHQSKLFPCVTVPINAHVSLKKNHPNISFLCLCLSLLVVVNLHCSCCEFEKEGLIMTFYF